MTARAKQRQNREPAVQYRLMPPHCADEYVLPGIRYGRPDELLSPAYWVMRCGTADPGSIDFVNRHGSLEEEIGFCLLGGFGITLEAATAFYERLRAYGTFVAGRVVSEAEIFEMLDAPASVQGRPRRYRFPKQRAGRISRALDMLRCLELDENDPISFRNRLQELDGIGPKTASWITRNWLDTDEVAILDIHVLRAGWHLGLFQPNCRLPSDYSKLENRFLMFARNLHVRPSVLDCVMWLDMRTFGSGLSREAG